MTGHVERTGCSTEGAVTFSVGLVTGTFSAIFCKMAYDSSSVGLDGHLKPFAKPIAMLLLMFSGMVPAIFFWAIQQAFRAPKDRDVVTRKTMILLLIPCLCDLLCTLLLLIAQLYITASMWQMMRGSVIIITALLKSSVLGHKLRKHMWAGVCVIAVSMIVVASTSMLKSAPTDPGSKDPRIGILLVLLGCVAQGVQYVFEEKVMAVDNVPPLIVIGMEGVWGTLLSLLVVYPIAKIWPGNDNGSFEDPFDSIRMISNSKNMQILLASFVMTVTCYNCMAIYVTTYLSAIWHAILDNFRPITIWGVDLLLFYVILPGQGFGEEWERTSWIQLSGLLILFLGTAVYNGSVMVCDHENDYLPLGQDDIDRHDISGVIKTELSMASPSMTRSPLVYQAAGSSISARSNEV
jgi:drug/metabolite transporter (DMT)-like permease